MHVVTNPHLLRVIGVELTSHWFRFRRPGVNYVFGGTTGNNPRGPTEKAEGRKPAESRKSGRTTTSKLKAMGPNDMTHYID